MAFSFFRRKPDPQPEVPPAAPVDQAVVTAAYTQPGAPTVTTLLLAEDDMVLQELYLDRFIQSGFSVLQAYDGEQALSIFREHPEINLVLLDLMLPKISGYDVLAQIRMGSVNQKVPIVIVSALADIDDQARGLQLGATDYITKGEMLPSAVIEKIKSYAVPVQGPTS
jgi:CheY-like chemotaxis protein